MKNILIRRYIISSAETASENKHINGNEIVLIPNSEIFVCWRDVSRPPYHLVPFMATEGFVYEF